MFVQATGTPATGGDYFMFYGDARGLVTGITDRLLFTCEQYRLRLTAQKGGHLMAHLHDDHNGGDLVKELRPNSSIVWRTAPRIDPPVLRERRLWVPMVDWSVDEVHAGLVPCRACLYPTASESVDKNGLACDNPVCQQSSTRQLDWSRVAELGGHIPADAINAWRHVLNIGGRQAG